VGGAEPGFRVCVYLPSAKESTVVSSNRSFYFNHARQGLSEKGLTDVYRTALLSQIIMWNGGMWW
jgi:hypothetical protein